MLLKCRQNIDPTTLAELTVLEDRIIMIKDILNKGTLTLTEFGILGMKGDKGGGLPNNTQTGG